MRHVVEVQSDLAQHAKVLPEAERAAAGATAENLRRIGREADQAYLGMEKATSTSDYAKHLDAYEKALDPDVLSDVRMRMGQDLQDTMNRCVFTPSSRTTSSG